jgi:hypothetical protein
VRLAHRADNLEFKIAIKINKMKLIILVILMPEDDPVKGSKHVAFANYAIKTNVYTILSICFDYC